MKRGDKKGFTIIEVSLVLAIAGLIFLMIFIALPALRRTQRDAARRDDMMNFIKEVKTFQTNNRGALPTANGNKYVVQWKTIGNPAATSWAGFFKNYMGEKFVDPDGSHYNLIVVKCTAASVGDECTVSGFADLNNLNTKTFPYSNYSIVVATQATCAGEKAVGVANPRKIAVLYRLEGAGVYCGST